MRGARAKQIRKLIQGTTLHPRRVKRAYNKQGAAVIRALKREVSKVKK